MGIRGAFQALRDEIARMRMVRSAGWKTGLSRAMGEEALEQIALGFERERDPYGTPWPKSQRAIRQGGQTLSDTAKMRRAWSRSRLVASPTQFVLTNPTPYAPYHQLGAHIGPRKQVNAHGRNGRFQSRDRSDRLQIGRVSTRISIANHKGHTLPQRMMVPEDGRPSPIWEEALQRAARRYVERTLGRAP